MMYRSVRLRKYTPTQYNPRARQYPTQLTNKKTPEISNLHEKKTFSHIAIKCGNGRFYYLRYGRVIKKVVPLLWNSRNSNRWTWKLHFITVCERESLKTLEQ